LDVFVVRVLVGTDLKAGHWRRYAAWLCVQAYLCQVKAFKIVRLGFFLCNSIGGHRYANARLPPCISAPVIERREHLRQTCASWGRVRGASWLTYSLRNTNIGGKLACV